MEYESVNFYSTDGVKLSAWEIPCKGSNRLAIISHAFTCNKYGFNPDLPGASKNTPVHVESLKLVKVLHKAGYNVITMDMRGHGNSDDSKEDISTMGPHEARDIIGCQ